jgi:hypothetical protein
MTVYEQLVQQAQALLQNQQYQRALDLYDLALTTNPDDLHLRYCVASLYSELYKSGIAISILKSVVKEKPDHAQAWNNLGIAYKNSGQWDKAHDAYQRALALNYDANTLINMSGLYINNGTPHEAIRWAEKGLKLNPGSPQLRNHRALGMLESGNLKEGFELYDGRFKLPGWTARNYSGPMWDGQPVNRLLIHGEQGLGDEILFMTAFDRVRARVSQKVIVECAERAKPVFQAGLPREGGPEVKCYGTAEEVRTSGETWDAWVPMGSLFRLVGWEQKAPYLKVTKPYPRGERFRIGLSWRGGTVITHEHLRNFQIEWWMPLLDHDAEFISLQYGPAAGMAKKMGLPHDQAAIDDFERLTGMIASCDLVISVCNTTVHQAAAIGTPCWVLTPSRTSWQFQLSGDKMPFYEVPRLFRQAPGEDWREVIKRIKSELERIGIAEREQAA